MVINREVYAVDPEFKRWWHSNYSVEFDHVSLATRRIPVVHGQSGCSAGGYLPDGSLFDLGGLNRPQEYLRAYQQNEEGTAQYEEIVGVMSTVRWYATVVMLSNGRLWIVGGATRPVIEDNNPTYEFYPPTQIEQQHKLPQLDLLVRTVPNNLYPHLIVMPHDGLVFVFSGRLSQLVNTTNGAVVREFPECPSGARTYPLSGNVIMLPLTYRNNYTVTSPGRVHLPHRLVALCMVAHFCYCCCFSSSVLACGGSTGESISATQPADNTCATLRPYDDQPAWVVEKHPMPIPRVMGQAVTLPTGQILFLNGAQIGFAGHTLRFDGSFTGLKADNPVYHPVLFHPFAHHHHRSVSSFTVLAPSSIPRLYHSSAILLPSGKVLVGGHSSTSKVCFRKETCKYNTELRLEAFSPPYLTRGQTRPVVHGVAASVTYGEQSLFTLNQTASLDGVVARLIHPPYATHGLSMNERVVEVALTLSRTLADGSLEVLWRAPPTPEIAPPSQHWMLWIVSARGIPSEASVVQLAAKPT